MTKNLQRFALEVEPSQKVEIPFGSEIVGLTEFQGKPYLWAIVDPENTKNTRTIVMVAEGKELDYRCNRTKHLGMFRAGNDMLHVFDLT